jgi:hypothetical protein
MTSKAILYNRYPLLNIIIYNGTTLLHFIIGGVILFYTNHFWGKLGISIGLLYILLSLFEMYVMMPLQVCKNCIYFKLENGLCISGMNILAKKIATKGSTSDFPNRAKGPFCANNLYILTLIFPILCGIPILILNYSILLLILVISLFVLLGIRFVIIIPKLACVHCLSKFICPQAGQMGVREK